MSAAHDIFSETNPAYCACALASFAAAFVAVRHIGPELPVAYLVLPIALSGDLSSSFDGTNRNTGLLEWLERNPQVQVGITDRVNRSMSVVTGAVRFGCFARVIRLDDDARLWVGDRKFKKSAVNSMSAGTARSLKHAERLGYWFAAAGSTKTVFDMVGLTV